MVGFVGGGDVGKGYMMSGKCWLQSVYSSPTVLLRAFNTFAQLDEDEWEEQVVEIYPAGGAAEQWTAFLVNNMVEDNSESKMCFSLKRVIRQRYSYTVQLHEISSCETGLRL